MDIQHWSYLYPKLNISGLFKDSPCDFQVKEVLGYEPIGEGEHIYAWVRKTGLNTAFLAEQIAKYAKLPLRAVTYAGRKDKHAQTEQWFGIHLPGKTDIDWSNFDVDGAEVLKTIRHNKKLRTGVLKANHFKIRIKELTDTAGLEERLETISTLGVPNYFGEQRFGDTRYDPKGGNLVLAEKMIAGEPIRNRNKRSMAISAMRSWFFNEVIHHKIQNNTLTTPQLGDVMELAGSNSFFCVDEINDTLINRLKQRDIFISAPMWGAGNLPSKEAVLAFEESIASANKSVTETLESLGLKQERRAAHLYPTNLKWIIDNNTLTLEFSLPSGAFATSVLRELVNI
ncbi:tRNA pseudouridine(13) synthase TruD [Paraglaciecola sp. 2405UD69-4]|uniref:tRNA pseudouridine(13) synthase TruD n=1 Tax=Paraglaciecola sp. 2405UD69-4 TaxID=3391836 RepID=UPI0039C9B3A4